MSKWCLYCSGEIRDDTRGQVCDECSAGLQVEKLTDEIIRLRTLNAKLLAACEAIWEADNYWRDSMIDLPDRACSGGARKLRDAWRLIRDAINEAKETTP